MCRTQYTHVYQYVSTALSHSACKQLTYGFNNNLAVLAIKDILTHPYIAYIVPCSVPQRPGVILSSSLLLPYYSVLFSSMMSAGYGKLVLCALTAVALTSLLPHFVNCKVAPEQGAVERWGSL